MRTVVVQPIGELGPEVWDVVAGWCLDEWAHLFPADTVGTYVDMFRWSTEPEADGLPVVLVALVDGEPVGTATLVADDELPDATEPGPWLAAVYVAPPARGSGVGRALVDAVVQQTGRLGSPALYCYTEHERTAEWYAAQGWVRVRASAVNGHDVVVMQVDLADATLASVGKG